MSSIELARTIALRPPIINRKIKPSAHSTVGDHSMLHPCRVSSQKKTYSSGDGDYSSGGEVGLWVDVQAYCKYVVGSHDKPRKLINIIAQTLPYTRRVLFCLSSR